MSDEITIEVRNLVKHFPVGKGAFARAAALLKAVDGVSFKVRRGQTLGLVGESGCGKTTAGRAILRLIEPTSGEALIRKEGGGGFVNIFELGGRDLRAARRRMQIIFQDPYGSLDPRMTAGAIVAEPLSIHGTARGARKRETAAELFEKVGLPPDCLNRYPHEFSGGQRQRIGIARALALSPEFIVCDEPVSALDVSIQAQIINLLEELQKELGLSYLFIAHDLAVVRHISDEVAVMYLGKIVERAAADAIFEAPLHPYTEALLSAVPVPDPASRRKRIILGGEAPSPIAPPPGCPFHPRCRYAFERCRAEAPRLLEAGPGHFASCFRAE